MRAYIFSALAALAHLSLFLPEQAWSANWPAWRGPEGTGVTTETNLPLTWSATKNVRWKTPLPERGNATPIIWGERIFITQNVGQKRTVTCFSRTDGKQLWQEGPTFAEEERTHATNPYCAASPVTDGERVVAWFGSAGLWCWDLDGKEQWHLDLGKQDHVWGYGGSPVLHDDLCFLNFGPGDRTFFIAVEKRTGKKVWQIEIPPPDTKTRTDGFAGKEGETGSWSTPLIVGAADRAQLIMSWPEKLVAYAPKTGEVLWSCGGLNPLIYTSPMFGEGFVVASGGFGGSTIALKPAGSGDLTSNRLWHTIRDKQRIGSGVITGGHLYILNTPGTAQCIDLKDGRTIWEERLQGTERAQRISGPRWCSAETAFMFSIKRATR